MQLSKNAIDLLRKFYFPETYDNYSYYFKHEMYLLCATQYTNTISKSWRQYVDSSEHKEIVKLSKSSHPVDIHNLLADVYMEARVFICDACNGMHLDNGDSPSLVTENKCRQCFNGELIEKNYGEFEKRLKQRKIVRYKNRKLYDTYSNRYVSLPEIEKIIKAHPDQEIFIFDLTKGKKDVTISTLLKIAVLGRKLNFSKDDLIEIIRRDS